MNSLIHNLFAISVWVCIWKPWLIDYKPFCLLCFVNFTYYCARMMRVSVHAMQAVDVRAQLLKSILFAFICFYIFLGWTQFICIWNKCFTHWEVFPTFVVVIFSSIYSCQARSPIAWTGLEFTMQPRMPLSLLTKCWVPRHTWPHLDWFWVSYLIFLSAPVHFMRPYLMKNSWFCVLWVMNDIW